ncbi:RyR domain-containing protein [Flavobacteriales bacterium]|nr:RyR domain-containing protein [Flavobacteriales bacterium]
MKKYTSELTAFIYIISFTLGLVGYLQTNEFDFISSCYNSLRLFILEFDGSVDNIPFLLNLSRFLSPLILASSIFLALKEYFNIALLNFKIRHLSGHTIVFCNNESDINFIHKKPNTLLVTNILFDGLSLTSENINDIEKVNIEKAEKVILLNDDRTNLSYLREIKKRFSNLKNITLYIRLEDNENVRMFNRFKLNTNFKKELLINPRQLFSREVFLNNPAVDYVNHHKKVPHALISGEYENIKWLIFEMANISHYPSLKNLKVTLIGNKSEKHKKMLIDEFPNIDQIIDFHIIVKSSTSISKEDLSLLDITAIYISEKTLEESQITASHLKRIFYSNKTNSINTCVINFGFGLIDDVYETGAFNSEFNIRYFDYKTLEDLNIIQHLDVYDIIAKSIHNCYNKIYKGTEEWATLSETMKMSNRYQAYHTNIKLGYLGYIVDVNSKADKISITYSESQLGVLAQMEKRRWNAERLLSGWIYGKKGDEFKRLKIHNLLVPWEKLDEKEKQKDRDTVANITNTITALGFSLTKVDE